MSLSYQGVRALFGAVRGSYFGPLGHVRFLVGSRQDFRNFPELLGFSFGCVRVNFPELLGFSFGGVRVNFLELSGIVRILVWGR